jgi:LacI family transcriptional regulator
MERRMARIGRRRRQAVTIQSVADHVGVSAMTVSNVINSTGKVGAETRTAVLAAIDKLGYSPNIAAQALASAGNTRIGLIYDNPQNAFLSAMLVGALHAASSRGAQVLLRNCERRSVEGISDTLKAMVKTGVNAILLAPPFCEMISGTPLVKKLKVPIGAVATGTLLPDMSTVRIDDRAAAQAITELLVKQGHTRIGFIGGPKSHSSGAERRAGYEAALKANGLDVAGTLIAGGAFTFESGLDAAEKLFALKRPPTAIFASNDDMAAAVVSLAHRRGLHIPNDLAVAGFDDTPIAIKIWPALTTIHQPINELAERAANLLITAARQTGAHAIQDETLDFRLIERESTGAPRTRR